LLLLTPGTALLNLTPGFHSLKVRPCSQYAPQDPRGAVGALDREGLRDDALQFGVNFSLDGRP
jgi:hypothetical protein